MAEHASVAIPVSSLKAHVEALKDVPQDIDQRIRGKFKMFVGTAANLDDTIWKDEVRNALVAFEDLIAMSRASGTKPGLLRRLKTYTVITDNLRDLMENTIMLRLGEDVDFNFALERGFEELLTRECKALDERGIVKCKIRFVKPRNIQHDGQYPIYERVTVRFDGQFDVSFIDRARYGM